MSDKQAASRAGWWQHKNTVLVLSCSESVPCSPPQLWQRARNRTFVGGVGAGGSESSLGSKEHGWAAWVCNLEISQSLQWLESSRSLTVAAPLRKALARTQLLRVECCCLLLFSTGCLQTPSAQQFLWDGRVGWWGQQYYLANTGNNNTPLLAATAELIIIMLVIFHC